MTVPVVHAGFIHLGDVSVCMGAFVWQTCLSRMPVTILYWSFFSANSIFSPQEGSKQRPRKAAGWEVVKAK